MMIVMKTMMTTMIVMKRIVNLNLCHQVIDAVQLGLNLGPSSPELPWLGLIIGILMY